MRNSLGHFWSVIARGCRRKWLPLEAGLHSLSTKAQCAGSQQLAPLTLQERRGKAYNAEM